MIPEWVEIIPASGRIFPTWAMNVPGGCLVLMQTGSATPPVYVPGVQVSDISADIREDGKKPKWTFIDIIDEKANMILDEFRRTVEELALRYPGGVPRKDPE